MMALAAYMPELSPLTRGTESSMKGMMMTNGIISADAGNGNRYHGSDS